RGPGDAKRAARWPRGPWSGLVNLRAADLAGGVDPEEVRPGVGVVADGGGGGGRGRRVVVALRDRARELGAAGLLDLFVDQHPLAGVLDLLGGTAPLADEVGGGSSHP